MVRVRPAEAEDLPAFLALVDALAEYEHLPGPDAEAKARLARDAQAQRFRLLLAEVDGAVVGYAVFFFTYSTFLARPTLYLEDLFVQPGARGHGAGLALFQACAAEAVRQRCGRLEWAVLDWNAPAIGFYERLGGRPLTDWRPFRLDGEALARVASGDAGPRLPAEHSSA